MSLMLDKLLKGQKVEWKKLNEIAVKISSGGTPKTGVAEYYNGDIPWLRTQEVNFDEIWETGIKITEEGLNNSSAKIIPANCVIVAMYGATVGKVGLNKIPMATNQACANIQVDENLANYRYVFHFLMSQYQYIKSLGTGSQTNINAQTVKNLEIPIPPLDVQAKIVKILDAFTALTAELTAELTMREKQYHYYRDKLLTFSDDEVEWKTLGEVANISSGGTPSKTNDSYWLNGDIPWLKSEVCKNCIVDESKTFITNLGLKNSSAKFLKVGTVLMAMVGATIFKTAYLTFEATTNQNIAAIKSKSNLVLDKYIFYFLINSYDELTSKLEGYNMINLSQIKLIKIPIPSLKEQKRIIAILDKFEMLTNSITEGLPFEIALRQQQYEYYREQLLDFPK